MAGQNEDRMSTEDLLRLFLLSFLSDTTIAAYVAGTYVNGQFLTQDVIASGKEAFNVDNTPT